MSNSRKAATGIVALFNASDGTIDMIEALFREARSGQILVWCHLAELKKGKVDFAKFLGRHNPEVVIFDFSPPDNENWKFFKTMRDSKEMQGRGLVLTTTNKYQLDQVTGSDSHALEVVGKPKDLQHIRAAIADETRKAREGACLAPPD